MEISPNENMTKLLLEKKAKNLPLLTRTNNGGIRYCEKCKCIKPDRAHHCGTCQACVLRMDHHCPWVNNCVGYNNYKFFLLFLFYAVVYCIFIALTSLEYFITFWNEIQSFQPGRFHLLFLFFVSIMFGISISSLLGYHIYLTCKNITTLETFRAPVFYSTGLPDKNGFNLSRKENFRQVFGNSFLKAFLPIKTSIFNGYDYSNLHRDINTKKNFIKNSNISATLNNFQASYILNNSISSNDLNIEKTKARDSFESKLNEVNHLNESTKFDSINTIKNHHASITFATIFKNQTLFKNQSTDISTDLIDSINVYHKNNVSFDSNNKSILKLDTSNNCKLENNNHDNSFNENESNIDESNRFEKSTYTQSLTDGITFPASINQTIVSSNALPTSNGVTSGGIEYAEFKADSLLLNNSDFIRLNNNHNRAGDQKGNNDQVRIFMEN